MCERDSCSVFHATTTETSTDESKCQAKLNGYQVQQQTHLIDLKRHKTNVNMLLHQQTQQEQQYQQLKQQQQQQRIHHIQMTYSANGSPDSSASSSSSNSSTSSLESNFNGHHTDATPATTPSIGVNLRVTGQCSQGGRKYMEDYFSVAYQQSENAKDLEYAFIGIYDGHGGAEAATFAKEHLMMEIINQKLFWSDSDRDVLRAIREGYIATHYAMWREQEKWPKTANGLPSTAGTTATIAFIRREKIYIGHVGDSGIVLGYQNENEHFWRAKQLTVDHKPESLQERTRIMRSGGKVVVKSGVPRVVWNRPRNVGHRGPVRRNTPVDEIPFLAVARSLGDLWSYNSAANEFVVSPDPDVRVIKINPKTFRCLIFGTDGLWNVVSAQEAVELVHTKETINERLQAQRGDSRTDGAQWTNPSKGLVEKALKTWSAKKMRADNTSVVTVILYPPNATEATACAAHNAVDQPNSCGLEYSQLNTEIPSYDDATTYQEMAEKYLPPPEYREFDYYADDTETLTPATDPLGLKYERAEVAYWKKIYGRVLHNDVCPESNEFWDLQRDAVQQPAPLAANLPATKSVVDTGSEGDEEDDVEDDDDDMDDDCGVDEDDDALDADELKAEVECNVTNYAPYLTDSSTSCSFGAVHALHAATDSGSYMSSFAESYNTLLNEQMSQEANTSNSNISYQSVSGSSMHEILQEQHLYQQQCMSEEEGYSLTKLETRREQQRCSAVQTFKIFQQHQETSTATASATATAASAPETAYPPTEQNARYAFTKYMPFQQLQPQPLPQKPLELHSLLQQEREEEQQLALERLELQRRLARSVVNPVASAQHKHNDTATSTNRRSSERQSECNTQTEDDEPLIEEYLEDEEELQSNEVSSSSNAMDTANISLSSSGGSSDDEGVDPLEDMLVDFLPEEAAESEIEVIDAAGCIATPLLSAMPESRAGDILDSVAQTPAKNQTKTHTPPHLLTHTPPKLIEKIEKIEILHENPELYIEGASVSTAKLRKSKQLPMQAASYAIDKPLTSTSAPSLPVKTATRHYPNIPNENQRSSLTISTHALRVFGRRLTGYASSPTVSASGARNMEKRQLRSSSICVDYSKRTLRTRNSLAKDLKAKNTLTPALKRASNGSVTTQFLRANAVSLLGNANSNNSCNSSSSNNNNNSNSNNNNNNSDKAHCSNSNTNCRLSNVKKPPTQLTTHVINLRSRQIGQLNSAKAPTAATNIAGGSSSSINSTNSASNSVSNSNSNNRITKATTLPALLRRRNLRSSQVRESASNSSTNYSKTTRLGAPPPSPKLISAAAAVMAATRARTLLKANKTAAATVAAIYGKRITLRSASGVGNEMHASSSSGIGGSSGSSSNSSVATRARVMKKLKR